MDAKIRKNQNMLITSGKALIIFGIWAIVRLILYELLDSASLNALVLRPGIEIYREKSTEALFNLTIFSLFIDLIFRLFLGSAAISEGKGQNRTPIYIVLDIIYVIFSILTDIYFLCSPSFFDFSLNSISSIFIDLTSIVALIIIIVSSISLRKLKKDKSESTKEAAYVS